jgi:virulence-associated protein VapD
MRKLLPVLFLLTFSIGYKVGAQEMKFGKYSQAELELTKVDFEPEAGSVVLEERSSNQFMGTIQHSTIHRRIKILKESAKDVANIRISFYAGEGIQNISKLNAQTINIENGIEKITKLGKDDFFEVDLEDNFKEVRFTFKDVKVGSIIEYSYLKTDKSITFLDSWVFHNQMPTLKSTYTIEIPSFLNYRFLAQGEKTQSCKYQTNYPGTYSWTVSDLSAIKSEPMISNYQDYVEKIGFQLAGYAFSNSATYGGGSGFKSTYTTWQELTESISEFDLFVHYLKPNAGEKSQILTFVPKGETETQKAKDIYNFVTKKYSYNGEYSLFPSKNLRTILESRTGQRSDINLTLLAYLRQNGLTAYPLLISSKGNGRSRLVDTPFLDQFNQLIVYAKVDDKEYFLDATNSERPFGYLPLAHHVSYGYVLKEKDSGLIPVQLPHRSGIVQMVNTKLDENSHLISESTVRFTDYDALTKMNGSSVDEVDTLKKYILGPTPENLLDFAVTEKTEPRKQLEAKFKYSFTDFDHETTFISPFAYTRWSENPFQSEVRTFPVDFLYTFTDNYTSIIEIPAGYEVDDYPEDTNISIPGGNAQFTYQVNQFDGQIKITSSVSLKYPLISPTIYPDLKYFMEILTTKLKEPVVLKKTARP